MNLVGIVNENEFYTNHYLNEIFEDNIKGTIATWQEKENESDKYKTPFKRLRGTGPAYLDLLKELYRKNNTKKDKLAHSRKFYKKLLDTLGYEFLSTTKELAEFSIPIIGTVNKADGSPYLWIVESYCDENCDVITNSIIKEQLNELDEVNEDLNYDTIITSHIFTLEEPPRWIMLVSPFQIVLIERAKWAQKRFLRFDLKEIIERKEDAMLKAFSVLLHSESLAPKDGLSLLDTLDENSHKHAFGVTEDLKYSLRSAVELLGNEAIYYHFQQNPDFLLTPELESDLTREALRYMYRMLFLFYIESRPELGFIPSKSAAFLRGYSLETLRDLELMPLLTDSDKNGYYFSESVSLYFDMIYNGRVSPKVNMTGKDIFSISPLRSHLFDPAKTPLLNEVQLRNHVWQDIIQSLSLSRPKKNKGRGRISYANLGINQLGAVYEALLSYKGFIAKETLYEVKKAGSNPTELENAYFVTETQLSEYKESERVFNTDGTIKAYKEGCFIYRLAGRDREKSASYYTPEVLTKSLVKYALKELLEIDEEGKLGKSADEILKLTVCEPAMGSAAFLNEAINQLSETYLHQKQIETGQKIPHDKYTEELQKVKMHIADNNVYGVDLNSTAVELAEISLWLNALSGSFVPWFGFQLENGNSLIGARREVYGVHQLTATKTALKWYEDAPKRLAPKSLWLAKKQEAKQTVQAKFDMFEKPKQQKIEFEEETKSAGRIKESEVYHFLLGDKAMANYTDRVVKALKKDEIESITKWRKEFIKPHTIDEVNVLLKLSLAIDKLWQEQTRHLDDMKKKTTDTLHIWGQAKAEKQQTNIEYKDTVFMQEKLSADVKSSSPYIRLKIVMDYWCSLWFWPIDKAGLLPSRAEFLQDISLLVEKRDDIIMNLDKDLFSDTIDEDIRATHMTELGFIDVAEQIEKSERLQVVQKVSQAQKFLHWELEFSDVFAKKGGFDLILGNPPWLKVEWNESGIMGEANPIFDIRSSDFKANALKDIRNNSFLIYPDLLSNYLSEYEVASATKNYLSAITNFPLLTKTNSNLYRCFIPLSWNILNMNGFSGLLHPERVYDDPRGGALRVQLYSKLKYHFHFINELPLFQDVGHTRQFSINITQKKNSNVDFLNISNLYHPSTIDSSFNHLGSGFTAGRKGSNGKWNTKGHLDRVLKITTKELSTFHNLYSAVNEPILEAPLPSIYSIGLLKVLEKLSRLDVKLGNYTNEFSSTLMWDEVSAQSDKIIVKNLETSFPFSCSQLILSGPHFFVLNPLYKCPNIHVKNHHDYNSVNLESIDIDYLPKTVFSPSVNINTNIPIINIGDSDKKITDYYRLAHRRRLSGSGERTMVSIIIPPDVLHTNTVVSTAFKDTNLLLSTYWMTSSIVFDYFVKATGKEDFYSAALEQVPIIFNKKMELVYIRLMALTCITSHYSNLWLKVFNKKFRADTWTKKNDEHLDNRFFVSLTEEWTQKCSLRDYYSRRQAMLELDVLAAQTIGLTLKQLLDLYRIQFDVLQKNENETFYDMSGNIVFTPNTQGLPGVGLPRKADKKGIPYRIVLKGKEAEAKALGWEDIINMKEGEVHRTIMDDTMLNGPIERTIIYVAPFAKCDREKDYEIAWAEFEKRSSKS